MSLKNSPLIKKSIKLHPTTLCRFVLLSYFMASPPLAFGETKTGFLVLAPDRGFLGNQEIRAVVNEFHAAYFATLALVGQGYTGVDGEYSAYFTRAVRELRQAGATELVIIPMFLSDTDPLLMKARAALPVYAQGIPLRWAPAMIQSYLISQIVLDRVQAISRQPETERLILIGIGATDEATERSLKSDIETLLAYVQRYLRFSESQAIVYYDRQAKGAEEKNEKSNQQVLSQIARQGRTLIVPAFIGPKFDESMALTTWLGKRFQPLNVAYQPEELLPHPNVLLWLKQTANRYWAAQPSEIGVVIMPHGSTQPWNDAVEEIIEPLKTKYRIEMAYGMGDPGIIQAAVSRLEEEGIKRIVFVRMYALSYQMKDKTDYMLGLTEQPPSHADHGGIPPKQIRSAALFSTFGGYEEFPEIATVLCERITEISSTPSTETVIVVAHGEKADEGNETWLSVMNRNIERMKANPSCNGFKAVHAATVREDWPDLREKAVADVRKLIEESGRNGRVLVIANRLYGSGPYQKMFKGLEFQMNSKGLVHPVIRQWLEAGIQQTITAWLGPGDAGQAKDVFTQPSARR